MSDNLSINDLNLFGNYSKENLSKFSDEDLLYKLVGWKATNDRGVFTLEEKDVSEGGVVLWGGNEISIEHNNFMYKINRSKTYTISISDIAQFYSMRKFEKYGGGKKGPIFYSAVYTFLVILKSGRHIKIATLNTLYDSRVFEIVLERRLAIQDRAVLHECNGTQEIKKIKDHLKLPKDTAIITEHVFCPKCNVALDDLQMNDSQDINYTCNICAETFSSKYKEQKMQQNNSIDKELSVSIEGKDLIFKREHKDPMFLYLGIGSFFLSCVFFAHYMYYLGDPWFSIIISLFMFASGVVNIFMLYRNYTIIRVSEDSIFIGVEPYSFFVGPGINVLNSDIEQLFVKLHSKVNFGKVNQVALCALQTDGTEIVLEYIKCLPWDRAINILQSMEVLIEKRLGIKDKIVSSEVL